MRLFSAFVFCLVFGVSVFAQTPNPIPTPTPFLMQPSSGNSLDLIAQEITGLSKAVQSLNKLMKDFVQHPRIKGIEINESRQKILLAFEILARAEQRSESLRKTLIELKLKEAEVKSRLAQIEENSNPQRIESETALIGSTRTPEIRENRRRALESERNSFQSLLYQISNDVQTLAQELRESDTFVQRLRRKLIPEIEKELDF